MFVGLIPFFSMVLAFFLRIGAFLTGSTVAITGAVSTIGAGFFGFLVIFQVIMWVVSLIFTIMLAFFGTEIITYLLDLTSITSYLNTFVQSFTDTSSSLNNISVISTNSFNTNFTDIFLYFSFDVFLNLVFSVVFGIIALKFNLAFFGGLSSGFKRMFLLSAVS